MIQEVAKVAQQLTVFQRTASYVVEAFNQELTEADRAYLEENHHALRNAAKTLLAVLSMLRTINRH